MLFFSAVEPDRLSQWIGRFSWNCIPLQQTPSHSILSRTAWMSNLQYSLVGGGGWSEEGSVCQWRGLHLQKKENLNIKNFALFIQEQGCIMNKSIHQEWWYGILMLLVLISLSTAVIMLPAETKIVSRVTKHKWPIQFLCP